MNFKEWLKSLEPERKQTTGEDVADTFALVVLMAMICFVIFL